MFKTVKRIIRWTGEYKKRLYMGFLWSFLQTMFAALPVMGAAYFLDLMIKDSRGEIEMKPVMALYALIFMVFSIAGRFLFSYLRATYQESIAYEKTAQERIEIGNILKRVSLGFFDKNNTGEIAGAVTTDLSVYELYAMKMTDVIIGAYVHVAAMILCLLLFCWQAALIALAGVALSAFFLHLMSLSSYKNSIVHQKAQNTLITSVIEFIRGIAVVKAYGQEGVSVQGIRDAFREHRRINIKIELDYVWCNGLHQLSCKLASVGIVLMSAYLCIYGEMTLPIFLMMAIFSFTLFSRVEQVQNGAHTMQLIEAAMDKLDMIKQAEFIDTDAKEICPERYDITFDHVSFGYDKRSVLSDVSFHIPQGSTAAIVGPSGSGKTTICNLLARFYDVNGGKITVGGHDVREFTCDSLLSNISMVFQNVYLFHDTIRNNICFGKPDATEEEMRKAAEKACCHEFIMALPDGYDTVIGEGGGTLSGGEKQRISIARAILKNAPIVILDEATASIDPENEHLIQAAISELTKGKTLITIAHRLATIENADQILVVDEGRIVQKGTHRELIGQEGKYLDFVRAREQTEGWQIQ
ncbi:ABC transporter ATP-binding protein [Marvinbryantia sp.]|uniref:ABC transporter ATP-binding protein n=1 Tax=Marvinbryantia sp. TaxID=2496532 RepID=UPI003A8E7A31